MKCKVGDEAPDFVLQTSSGEKVRLSDFRGKKNVVVYFYPADGTPGCTAQACGFRDAFETFREFGTEVLGISSDSAQSHTRFTERHRLPFRLLSDVGGTIRQLYDIPKTLGLIAGRVTFVIDKKGIVRQIVSSPFNPRRHVAEALRILQNLPSE